MNRRPQLRLRVHPNDDPVLHERHMRRLGIHVTSGIRVTAKLVATLRSIEKLRLERALERLRRNPYLNRRSIIQNTKRYREQKQQTNQKSNHVLSITAATLSPSCFADSLDSVPCSSSASLLRSVTHKPGAWSSST